MFIFSILPSWSALSAAPRTRRVEQPRQFALLIGTQVAAQFRRRGEGEVKRENILVGHGEFGNREHQALAFAQRDVRHVEDEQVFALAGVANFRTESGSARAR